MRKTFKELCAADLMTRDVITARAEDSLRQAAERMNRHAIHCLYVARADHAPGMITAKDIVQLLGEADEGILDELSVRDAMTSPVFCLQEGQPIDECINLMRMAGVRRMPVIAGDTLLGILSSTDILRALGTGNGTSEASGPTAKAG